MDNSNKLKAFFTEHWKYMAVNAACKLDIFDNLDTPKSAEILANLLNLNAPKLELLLQSLVDIGFLEQKNKLYFINELSILLTQKNPDSLKFACMNWGGEHMDAWQMLDFTVATGKSSFEAIYKKPYFEYLNEKKEKLDNYHKAMFEYAKADYKELPNLIDFGQHQSIMDVGGGYGAAIIRIKEKYPQVTCTLFDLQNVLQKLNYQDIILLKGDFFQQIPTGNDALLLCRILHDWNDKKATLILQNCFAALPQNGTLYVIENCADKINTNLSLLSLNMSVMCESFERTSVQYISLCEGVDFRYIKDLKLNDLQTILIFKK